MFLLVEEPLNTHTNLRESSTRLVRTGSLSVVDWNASSVPSICLFCHSRFPIINAVWAFWLWGSIQGFLSLFFISLLACPRQGEHNCPCRKDRVFAQCIQCCVPSATRIEILHNLSLFLLPSGAAGQRRATTFFRFHGFPGLFLCFL